MAVGIEPTLAAFIVGAVLGIAVGVFKWDAIRQIASGSLLTELILVIVWAVAVGPFSYIAGIALMLMVFVGGFAAGYVLAALHMVMVHVQTLLQTLHLQVKDLLEKSK
ncbi:MAG: hypothetical protein ACP5I3_09985 [Thermoproteus sp.]